MCEFSGNPVRYASGELLYSETDLISSGYGVPWGHTRRFLNRLSVPETLGNGYNWQIEQWPYLIIDFEGNVTIMGQHPVFFDKIGTAFTPRFAITHDTLTYDSAAETYTHTAKDGTVTEFNAVTRMFTRRTAPGGSVIEVKAVAANGFNITPDYSSGPCVVSISVAESAPGGWGAEDGRTAPFPPGAWRSLGE